eukprot:scaffold9206_cov113-Isochrysis_galbana.AAC.4
MLRCLSTGAGGCREGRKGGARRGWSACDNGRAARIDPAAKSCFRMMRRLAFAPVTEVEQILERRAEQVHDHDIVVALDRKGTNGGDPHPPTQNLVQLRLVQELRVLALD